MPDIPHRVLDFMREAEMPAPGSRVLAAVSGGADSVAMLLLLQQLGFVVTVAHCNFGLRPEAIGEEQWVEALCRRLGIRCQVRRFGAPDFEPYKGEGTQQAARKLRYSFFEESMATLQIPFCATAHQADDQLETQVLSFFRGNGMQLLHGIPALRAPYFRPLLPFTKAELMAWLRSQGQDWCHDGSNDEDDYQRNVVRNRLFPVLRLLNPSFDSRFARQAERYAAQQDWMQSQFVPHLPAIVQVQPDQTIFHLDVCHAAMGPTGYLLYIDWWLGEMGFTATQIDEIQKLVGGQVGATLQVGEQQVLRDRDCLRIRSTPTGQPLQPMRLDLDFETSSEIRFGRERIGLCCSAPPSRFGDGTGMETHWIDLAKLSPPVTLRLWAQGDRIQPIGLQGSKLVSDILIDQKRDRFAKAEVWVLEDARGIVLVSGYRIAARVAIDDHSTTCLRVQRHPSV